MDNQKHNPGAVAKKVLKTFLDIPESAMSGFFDRLLTDGLTDTDKMQIACICGIVRSDKVREVINV